MPACSSPPNRPPREVLDRLINDVAWAKTCMIFAAATAPKSADRARELDKFRVAVAGPRKVVDEIFEPGQAVSREVIIQLRACELAIPQLEAGAILRQAGAEQ